MKRFFLLLMVTFVMFTLTCSANMNYSYSQDGQSLNANIKRVGNYIYLKYKMGGVNSPSVVNQVPVEYQQAMSGISTADVDIVVDCSAKKMKVNSLSLFGNDGSNSGSFSSNEWVPITSQEDLAKFNDLCGRI